MNGPFRFALAAGVLCLGTACGTVQTLYPPAPSAAPHTPALPSVDGEGEAVRGLRADNLKSPSRSLPRSTNSSAKSQVRVIQKWNLIWWFGNVDDPEPPDWYRPGSPSRRWLWQLRNPLHNFTFYVIGIADREFTRSGKFPDAVFALEGGWNWAVAKHKCLRLPFVSFNGERWRFYLGWRERGNFGGKVNFGKLPAPDAKPKTADTNPS